MYGDVVACASNGAHLLLTISVATKILATRMSTCLLLTARQQNF
jgi:hypothetical protein